MITFPAIKEVNGFKLTINKLVIDKLIVYRVTNEENGQEVFRYEDVTWRKAMAIFDSISEEIDNA